MLTLRSLNPVTAIRLPLEWWHRAGPDVNKRIVNPLMLCLAGRRHWYAARIEHVGRRSGATYATPVVARRIHDGYAVPLPYGETVDWLRNLRAAGRAVLVADGTRQVVTDPRVVPFADIEADLPWGARATYRLTAPGAWLHLSVAPAEPETLTAPPAGTVAETGLPALPPPG
jgi:deazaflavin-dependent oxidoreductase (nitroreductase family)